MWVNQVALILPDACNFSRYASEEDSVQEVYIQFVSIIVFFLSAFNSTGVQKFHSFKMIKVHINF